MHKMIEEVKYCDNIKNKHFNKSLCITKSELKAFKSAKSCYLCNELYTPLDKPFKDRCSITGKYQGSVHPACSAKMQLTEKIPVIFHNLRGYDSHFIMQEIGIISNKHKMNINVIPNNLEKYMSFMLGNNLTFIDSFQFMSRGLSNLASNLPDETYLRYTSEEFQDDKLKLMKKKGVYPYDYMSSFNKFNDTQLPPKASFHSQLNDEDISDKDYTHAQKVWESFGINTMGECHDLCLKSDILLLADVFENFRKTCMQYYKLDPCHYFTSPGLSWDSMLKMTNIKLELMTDVDMYGFIEKGMRGGISYISHRYGQANNKYMSNYDEFKPSKYLMYLDANNLYGWAMSQNLPTGNFRWYTEDDITNLDLNKYKEDSSQGLILEVNLEYPQELHDLHNDYHLAPEKVLVNDSMFSPYCKRI